MTDAIYVVMVLLIGAMCFLAGRTMPNKDTIREIKKEEVSEETQRKIRQAEREYRNFLAYDGTKQTDDIDDQ